MTYLLGIIRLVIIMLITCVYVIGLFTYILFKGENLEVGYAFAHSWAKTLSKIVGLRLKVEGDFPKEGVLVMCNHRSYSDIFVVMSLFQCSFLAKAEVRKWPVLGYGAAIAGHMFVKREDPESRKQALVSMKKRLEMGYTVILFPEGTTFKGPGVKPFKPGAFKMAAEAQFPIVPTAIAYEHLDAAWVGKDTFLPHFIRIFGRLKTNVTIRLGKVMVSDDAKFLATQSEEWIVASLAEMGQ